MDFEHLYETKQAAELNIILKSSSYPPKHEAAIIALLNKAHAAAQFYELRINEAFLKDYLNDVHEIDSLVSLRKAVSYDSDTYSRSHLDWLLELSVAKLRWTWDRTSNMTTLITLQKSLDDLHRITYASQKIIRQLASSHMPL